MFCIRNIISECIDTIIVIIINYPIHWQLAQDLSRAVVDAHHHSSFLFPCIVTIQTRRSLKYHYFFSFMNRNFEKRFLILSMTLEMILTGVLFLVSTEWKCRFSPSPKKWSRASVRKGSASRCRGVFQTSLASLAYLPIDQPRVESACRPITLHIPSTSASFPVLSKQWL